MQSLKDHLIERAAARLAQSISETKPSLDSGQQRGSRDLGGWQSSIGAPAATIAIRDEGQKERIGEESLAKAGLIYWDLPYSRVAEEFRIIQHKILRQSFGSNGVASTDRGNLLMITSALKGEGKSFIAMNLAGEIVRQGDRRVLLVDTDPKSGGLGQLLGLTSSLGLLDLARDDLLDLVDVIVPTAAKGLDVLPFGTNGEQRGELFASSRMLEVIVEMGNRFADRLIIFDAPPCLASSAPHTLAAAVGQTVLVVAANRTQQMDVEAACDLVQACPHVSLVLNKIEPWMAHSFGSYSYATLAT